MRKTLNKCFDKAEEIKEKEEDIIELKLKIKAAKCQIITDMPRGRAVGNSLENYLIKLEKLQSEKKALERQRNNIWQDVKSADCRLLENAEIMNMLYLRFYLNTPWNEVARRLKKLYPNTNWNANKCFRVLNKINKIRV